MLQYWHHLHKGEFSLRPKRMSPLLSPAGKIEVPRGRDIGHVSVTMPKIVLSNTKGWVGGLGYHGLRAPR